jgi:hypothetical protein
VRELPVDEALQALVCGECRRKWQKIMRLPRAAEI